MKIKNENQGIEIRIENNNWISINPRMYDDNQHFIIEFKEFDFYKHTRKCSDCNHFFKAIGTDSLEWSVEYQNTTYRLDLRLTKDFGSTKVSLEENDFEMISIIQLAIHEIPFANTEIQSLLNRCIENEHYEQAVILRDLLLN